MHGLDPARPAGEIGRRRVGDALGEGPAVRADELDGVARLEAPLDLDDADGEQARARAGERTPRALVDVQPAGDGLAVPQPELERGRRLLVRREARAARLARNDRQQDVPAARRPRSPSGSRPTRPAPRRRSCSPCRPCRGSSPRRPRRHGPRAVPSPIGSAPGVAGGAGVDALDLGQQHEQPGADEDRDLRRERVVVAERDLVGRRRVVLVHDRHDAARRERGERVAGVQVGGAVGEVRAVSRIWAP